MTPETEPPCCALPQSSFMVLALSLAALSLAAHSLAVLAGCGAKQEAAPRQTAAHVNKNEITVPARATSWHAPTLSAWALRRSNPRPQTSNSASMLRRRSSVTGASTTCRS